MTFDEILAHVLDLLQHQGRISYRAIKRRFALDDDYLEDLKAEIIKAQRLQLGEMDSRQSCPDVATAEAHDGAAIVLADELGMRPLQAHCHHGLGNLYATTGQLE